jgi:RHS repeat-associated protein
LLLQQTGFANFDKLRDLNYQYDQLNNVTQRADLITEVEESFTYDNLDRLKSSTVVSTAVGENLTETKTYAYDTLGNITHKSDLGDYSYSSVRPHAVTSAGGNTYAYDDNGNMISGAGRTITWSSFNKPISMAKDGKYVDFAYAPDRARYLKTGSDGTKTLYLDKLYELITKGQEVTHKQFIYAGSSLVAVHVSGLDHNGSAIPVQTRYMHKDNLGSVDTITDGTGTVVDRMSFDPFGSRRQSNWREATVGINLIPVLTNRGFTGHEHIDEMDLIHMNGRVYDPTLGRFLSADPHIQSPYSTQSYNRYSYVSNNPLKYTDPSGYFLGKLFSGIAKVLRSIGRAIKSALQNPIIRMGLAIYGAYAIGSAITTSIYNSSFVAAAGAGSVSASAAAALYSQAAIIGGAVGGFAGGLIASGGDFSAALIGGFTGASAGFIGTSGWGTPGKAFAHGMVGGVTSKIQGGKFGHGFMNSAFSKFVSGKVHNSTLINKDPIMGGVAMAMIGGTASALGGGKFANGARTAATQYLFNEAIPKAIDWFASGKGKVDMTGLVPGTRSIRGVSKPVTESMNLSIDDEMNVDFGGKISRNGAQLDNTGKFELNLPTPIGAGVGADILSGDLSISGKVFLGPAEYEVELRGEVEYQYIPDEMVIEKLENGLGLGDNDGNFW